MAVESINKAGWTSYEPVRCQCVKAHVANTKVQGVGNKPCFVLELITLDSYERKLVKFLNTKLSPKNNYSVKPNSDFAKLYRLTYGENPTRRYSRANQLLKHFEGREFIADFEEKILANGQTYFKVTKLEPVDPITTDEWFISGELKGKQRGRYYREKQTEDKQKTGNDLAKNRQKTDNDLAIKNAVNPLNNLALTHNSTSLKDITYKVKSLNHKDIRVISDKERVYSHHQKDNETTEQYHQRVINETF